MLKKVNVLQGSWVDKFYRESVRPKLEASNISIFSEKLLELTHLHDDGYWGGLRSSPNAQFAVIDHRHWYYDDDTFNQYVKRIVSVKFPIVRIFELPFGFEKPNIEVNEFAKKLSERTARLSEAIKEAHPQTILLSPGIGVMPDDYISPFLNFIINSRSFFDGYAVHVCNDMSEHVLGKLGSLLAQVMEVLPRKIWITKWAAPSFEGVVANSGVIGPLAWEPMNYNQARHRMRRAFSVIDSASPLGSHWFYTGLCRDIYKPRRTPSPQEFWNTPSMFIPESYQYMWNFRHFLGMGTFDGTLKKVHMESFLQLSKEQNS